MTTCPRNFTRDELIAGLKTGRTMCVDRKDAPELPVTIAEIVDCAKRVREAGAAIVHLHARNPDESPLSLSLFDDSSTDSADQAIFGVTPTPTGNTRSRNRAYVVPKEPFILDPLL